MPASPDPARPGFIQTAISLRVFIDMRWLFYGAQLFGVILAERFAGIDLATGLIFIAIGAGILSNMIIATSVEPSHRLREGEAVGLLLFDTAQIAFMLFLTGGLANPFCVLALAPVALSASALGLGATAFLAGAATGLVGLSAVVHLPLRTHGGAVILADPSWVAASGLALVSAMAFIAFAARGIHRELAIVRAALDATHLALEREQRLADISSMAAATAHELATPLSTVTVIAQELSEEIDDPALREDIDLLRGEARRCRDLLGELGRTARSDLMMQRAPLAALVQEAATPIAGLDALLEVSPEPGGGGPGDIEVIRRPDIIHALRNLLDNAGRHARRVVSVHLEATDDTIVVRIRDDGPGFSPADIRRLSHPSGAPRAAAQSHRDGHSTGLGIGLFISSTLLARTHAHMLVDNARNGGAEITISWPRAVITAPDLSGPNPLHAASMPVPNAAAEGGVPHPSHMPARSCR